MASAGGVVGVEGRAASNWGGRKRGGGGDSGSVTASETPRQESESSLPPGLHLSSFPFSFSHLGPVQAELAADQEGKGGHGVFVCVRADGERGEKGERQAAF